MTDGEGLHSQRGRRREEPLDLSNCSLIEDFGHGFQLRYCENKCHVLMLMPWHSAGTEVQEFKEMNTRIKQMGEYDIVEFGCLYTQTPECDTDDFDYLLLQECLHGE